MAPHSSTLAWKIPWMEEPGGLLSFFTFMHWRRKWQPTPAFLPGHSQGWRSPVGCRLWGPTELDSTEATQQQQLRLPKNFPGGSVVKNLPANAEDMVQSLGWEDPLENEMALQYS